MNSWMPEYLAVFTAPQRCHHWSICLRGEESEAQGDEAGKGPGTCRWEVQALLPDQVCQGRRPPGGRSTVPRQGQKSCSALKGATHKLWLSEARDHSGLYKPVQGAEPLFRRRWAPQQGGEQSSDMVKWPLWLLQEG